jgi:hypothetical protein
MPAAVQHANSPANPFASPAAIDNVRNCARATPLLWQRQPGRATREHPVCMRSCLPLSRLVSTGREDRLGLSASEDACAYSYHLTVYSICEFIHARFETLTARGIPRSSALPIMFGMGLSCDGADHPEAAARPCVSVSSRNPRDADPGVLIVHSIMHHFLSDLRPLVHDIGCGGSYNRRQRINLSLPPRITRLLKYLLSLCHSNMYTRHHVS